MRPLSQRTRWPRFCRNVCRAAAQPPSAAPAVPSLPKGPMPMSLRPETRAHRQARRTRRSSYAASASFGASALLAASVAAGPRAAFVAAGYEVVAPAAQHLVLEIRGHVGLPLFVGHAPPRSQLASPARRRNQSLAASVGPPAIPQPPDVKGGQLGTVGTAFDYRVRYQFEIERAPPTPRHACLHGLRVARSPGQTQRQSRNHHRRHTGPPQLPPTTGVPPPGRRA